jgi:hypothetical protein
MNFNNKSKLDESLNLGLNYLYNHQLPNGEFISYLSGDAEMKAWIRPDSTVFITALITYSLHYINSDISEYIQSKSLNFLDCLIPTLRVDAR